MCINKYVKWTLVSLYILLLLGCSNTSATIPKIKVENNSIKTFQVFTYAKILFTLNKKNSNTTFLESYEYDMDYYSDEKEWNTHLVTYKNHPTQILGCIKVALYFGNGIYKNCSNETDLSLNLSEEDIKKVRNNLIYNVNKEFIEAGHDTYKLEKLLAKFHSAPQDEDVLQHKLIHRLEAIYKSKPTASNYFKLHNLIDNYYSAFYDLSLPNSKNNRINYYKKMKHEYLIKAYRLSKNTEERRLIKQAALNYTDFVGFGNFVDSASDIAGYKHFLRQFGLTPNQKMITNNSAVYYYLDQKKGKLRDIDTIDKLIKSDYYNDVLKHKIPKVSTGYSNDTYYFKLEYNVANERTSFRYTFVPVCKFIKRTMKVEDLGFFEVFGTGGMAESKNVTYNVYSCNLKKTDIRKIKYFEHKLGINDFSKVLNKAPWNKYEVINKTYNQASHVPPVSTFSDTRNNTSSSSSAQNYTCTFKCKGVDGIKSSVNVSESSNHRAQIKSAKLANRWCKDSGFSEGVLSQWGTGSTDCTKRY